MNEPFIASREQVVAEARRWLHTPFGHQQRMRGVQVDCAGLLIGVARALNLKPMTFDVTGYPQQPDGNLKRYLDEHLVRLPREQMQAGDVVLIRWGDGEPQHVGIVADHPKYENHLSMIHALGPRKPAKVIETRLLFNVAMRYVASYSIPGVG